MPSSILDSYLCVSFPWFAGVGCTICSFLVSRFPPHISLFSFFFISFVYLHPHAYHSFLYISPLHGNHKRMHTDTGERADRSRLGDHFPLLIFHIPGLYYHVYSFFSLSFLLVPHRSVVAVQYKPLRIFITEVTCYDVQTIFHCLRVMRERTISACANNAASHRTFATPFTWLSLRIRAPETSRT